MKGMMVGRGIEEAEFAGLELIISRGKKMGWVRVMTQGKAEGHELARHDLVKGRMSG